MWKFDTVRDTTQKHSHLQDDSMEEQQEQQERTSPQKEYRKLETTPAGVLSATFQSLPAPAPSPPVVPSPPVAVSPTVVPSPPVVPNPPVSDSSLFTAPPSGKTSEDRDTDSIGSWSMLGQQFDRENGEDEEEEEEEGGIESQAKASQKESRLLGAVSTCTGCDTTHLNQATALCMPELIFCIHLYHITILLMTDIHPYGVCCG